MIDLRHIIGAICFAVVWWILLSLHGCKSQCVPERYEVHDTIVRVDSVLRTRDSIVYRDRQDSTYIWQRDSMAMRLAGDTIYCDRWHTRYEYVLKAINEATQTATQTEQTSKDEHKSTTQQVIVRTERYIPKFYHFTMWVFWILVAFIVLRLAWWICGKIPATKPYIMAAENFFKNIRLWQLN